MQSAAEAFELSLWEIEAEPIADLTANFPQGHNIFDKAANPNDPAIKSADFVFIDPPDKSHWTSIREIVRHLEPKQSVLVLLPIGADTSNTPPAEDRTTIQCREDALRLSMGVSIVRWERGGRTIGCQLLYRVNAAAQRSLREAVEEVESVFRKARHESISNGLLGVRHSDP